MVVGCGGFLFCFHSVMSCLVIKERDDFSKKDNKYGPFPHTKYITGIPILI